MRRLDSAPQEDQCEILTYPTIQTVLLLFAEQHFTFKVLRSIREKSTQHQGPYNIKKEYAARAYIRNQTFHSLYGDGNQK